MSSFRCLFALQACNVTFSFQSPQCSHNTRALSCSHRTITYSPGADSRCGLWGKKKRERQRNQPAFLLIDWLFAKLKICVSYRTLFLAHFPSIIEKRTVCITSLTCVSSPLSGGIRSRLCTMDRNLARPNLRNLITETINPA